VLPNALLSDALLSDALLSDALLSDALLSIGADRRRPGSPTPRDPPERGLSDRTTRIIASTCAMSV